jgi:hypothetical protein
MHPNALLCWNSAIGVEVSDQFNIRASDIHAIGGSWPAVLGQLIDLWIWGGGTLIATRWQDNGVVHPKTMLDQAGAELITEHHDERDGNNGGGDVCPRWRGWDNDVAVEVLPDILHPHYCPRQP